MPYLDKPLQNLFRVAIFLSLVTALATLLSSCNGGNLPSSSQTGTSDAMFEAVVGTLDSFLDEVDTTLGTTQFTPTGACIHSFQCAASSSTLTRVYTDCIYDLDKDVAASAKVNGQSVVSFSNEAACTAYRDGTTIANGTTITKQWTNFSILDMLRNETFAVTSTSSLSASYNTNEWTVTFPEVSRASGNYTFKIKTPPSSSMTFTGARKTGNRQLSNATLAVTDASNSAAPATYNVTLGFLQWKSATCCLPTFGGIEVVDNTTSAKTTYTFSSATCGVMTRTGSDGVEAAVTLRSGCE